MLFKRLLFVQISNTLIQGLTTSFFIEKTLAPEPNSCLLKIYNLKRENRHYLREQKSIPVVIKAGYENNVGLLFKGDLAETFSIREGPDWITTIRSSDGLFALQSARINKTFRAGTSVIDVLNEVIKTLGINSKDAADYLRRHSLPSFSTGTAISGNSFNELQRLLHPLGFQASIQDGTLQVLAHKKALEHSAVVLSSQTGLLGSPEASNKGIARCRALLQHDIFPGRLIQINSQEIKETLFRVERARFSGDTKGQDWYVDLEARKL